MRGLQVNDNILFQTIPLVIPQFQNLPALIYVPAHLIIPSTFIAAT